MANYYPEFGKLLNRYLNNEDRAPAWLAKQLKVSASTVTRWLNDGTRPGKAETVLRIAHILNIENLSEQRALLEAAGYDYSAREFKEDEPEALFLDEGLVGLTTPELVDTPITIAFAQNRPFQAPPNIQDFVGRQELLDAIQNKLKTGGQICILQGMGGVGKTAVAIHLAYTLDTYFPDGVLWANLENVVTDKQLNESAIKSILNTFIEPFGRKLNKEYDLAARSRILREVLANKKVLVILDNASGTEDVEPLLPPTSGCAALITTRNRRMLRDRATSFDVLTFTHTESLSLLEEIIGRERVRQELYGAKQIINLVGGLPLALKIIASDLAEMEGVTLLEYYEMLLEERSRLDALVDWEDASKDVRASFELSYRRLPDDFKKYFATQAVFEGNDFSAEAIAAVINLPVAMVKIRILSRFHDLSLLEESQHQVDSKGARYQLHPLLRAFAQEKLPETGLALAELRARATAYFVKLATEQKQSVSHLDIDWENILGVLHWSQAVAAWHDYHQGVAALTYQNLGVVGYMDTRGYWHEAKELLTTLLSSPIIDSDNFQKAVILYKLGTFCLRLAQSKQAEPYLQQSLALLQSLSDNESTQLLQAQVYESLSQLSLEHGEVEAAQQWIEKGLAALQSLDSARTRYEMGFLQIRQVPVLARLGQWPAAISASQQGLALLPPEPSAARVSGLMNLGNLYDIQGNTEAALLNWQQATEQAQHLGDNRRLAQLWQNLSVAQVNAGRIVQALPLAEKALAAYERIGDMSSAATIRSNLAEICIYLQQYEGAQAHLTQSLDLARQLALPRTEVFALVNQARWFLDKRQLADAQEALQQADNLRQQANEPLQEAEIHRLQAELALYQANYEEALRQTEAALTAAAENGEWKEQGAAWLLQGDIWQAQGKADEAQAAYQRSLDSLGEHNLFETARTQLALGQFYRQSPTPEQAGPFLEAALAAFAELQMPHLAEQIREVLGRSQPLSGEPAGKPQPETELESPVPIERAEADAELAEPASRFVQERKLTSGGHGDIFLGRDTLTGEPVAIKRLKPEIVTQDPDIVARFLQEAEVLRRLDHPNIVKLLAVAETEAGTMIVMEYIPGGSLRDLLDKEPRLPLRHALDIALELADALARTHHLGIIHRDLKPANVLLAADGTPRLTDFGIARMTQRETRLTQTGSFLGTVAYLSPEACQGGELNERHDIWSFGMMLYEVLAGQLPFAADNPVAMIQAVLTESVPDLMQSRPDVPLKLVALIERMLSKDSAMRPSRMRQIAAELEAIRDDVGL